MIFLKKRSYQKTMHNSLKRLRAELPLFAAHRASKVTTCPGKHGRAMGLVFAWLGLLLSPVACNEDEEGSSKNSSKARSELCQKDCERAVNCEEDVEDPEAELQLCTKECIEYLDQSEKNDGRSCVEAREEFIDCLVTMVGCEGFDEAHPCQKKLEKEMQLCPDNSEPDQAES